MNHRVLIYNQAIILFHCSVLVAFDNLHEHDDDDVDETKQFYTD